MFLYELFVYNGVNLELMYKFNLNYIMIVLILMFYVLGFNDIVLLVLMLGGIFIF